MNDENETDLNKESPTQDIEQLRKLLKKSINKNKTLHGEFQKVLDNNKTLEEAVRTRTELILQLTAEKEKNSVRANELQEKLDEKEKKIQEMTQVLEQKDKDYQDFSQSNTDIITAFNEERSKLNQEIFNLKAEIEKMEELKKQISNINAEKEELQNKLSSNNEKYQKLSKELFDLKKQIALNQPTPTDILLDFSPQLDTQSAETTANDEINTNNQELSGLNLSKENNQLKEQIVLLTNEISQLKGRIQLEKEIIEKPSPDSLFAFNEEKKKFNELRQSMIQEIEDKQNQMKAERTSLEELKMTVSNLSNKQRRDQAKFEQESYQFRQEKSKFDDSKRELNQKRMNLENDIAIFNQEKAAFNQKKRECEKELEKLEKLKETADQEAERLESTRAEFNVLDEKNKQYKKDFAEFSEKVKDLNEQKKLIEMKSAECEKILALKAEVENTKNQNEIESQHIIDENEKIARLNAEIEARQETFEKESKRLKDLSETLENKDIEMREREVAIEKFQKELDEFKQEKEKLKPQFDLQAELDEASNNFLNASKLNAKLQEKNKKLLNKIQLIKKSGLQVNSDYLKKVLLQFFLQDDLQTRSSLIPVMLRLVQCEDKEIQVAMKKWADSQQIVNRSFWSFS
ncbi:hypothetical protein M9Y10_021993 [Tritrichomonas musculus]|uniref:GRIP domain-containing protein n=1 Tax=Tritrichomonas musculus TaxID=1915356 RepID=A0ABR2KUA6_9EUKA